MQAGATAGNHAGCKHYVLCTGAIYCPRTRLVYVNTALALEGAALPLISPPQEAAAFATVVAYSRYKLRPSDVLGHVWVRQDVILYGMRAGDGIDLKVWTEGQR